MSARLPTDMLVGALIRRVAHEGGFATVLCKGDPTSGVILVQLSERGTFKALLERITGLDGRSKLSPCGPAPDNQGVEIIDYITKRRRSDPDLWLVELDIAQGERFAAEALCID